MSNEVMWYLSRATGVVSIALLTVTMCLGMITSGRRAPEGHRAAVVMGLHRWLSLGMVAFLLTHIATAIAETYVSIDLVSAVVPFTSSYSTLWVGLGTLAVDIMIAVMATSWLRHRMPERSWRLIHWLAYLLWPVALVHGFMMGTSDQPLLRGVSAGCALAGLTVVGWRFSGSFHDRERRAEVAGQEWT